MSEATDRWLASKGYIEPKSEWTPPCGYKLFIPPVLAPRYPVITDSDVKRYCVHLNKATMEELQKFADRWDMPRNEVLRQCVMVGLKRLKEVL